MLSLLTGTIVAGLILLICTSDSPGHQDRKIGDPIQLIIHDSINEESYEESEIEQSDESSSSSSSPSPPSSLPTHTDIILQQSMTLPPPDEEKEEEQTKKEAVIDDLWNSFQLENKYQEMADQEKLQPYLEVEDWKKRIRSRFSEIFDLDKYRSNPNQFIKEQRSVRDKNTYAVVEDTVLNLLEHYELSSSQRLETEMKPITNNDEKTHTD